MEKLSEILLSTIEMMIEEKMKSHSAPKMFQSVVYKVNEDNTYQIVKDKQIYNVKNGLGYKLSIGQGVWVVIPNNELRNMFICGVRNGVISSLADSGNSETTEIIPVSFEVTDGYLIMTCPDDVETPDMHIDENGYLIYTPN